MVVVRCTRKLLARVLPPVIREPPRSTTVLGDWYGNLVAARPTHVVVFLSQRSRLPVLLPGQGMRHLTGRFADAVASVLGDIGVSSAAIQQERARMSEIVFARTDSRSMLASMNDFVINLKWLLQREPQWTLRQIAAELSEMPVGTLGHRSPGEVTLALMREAEAPTA